MSKNTKKNTPKQETEIKPVDNQLTETELTELNDHALEGIENIEPMAEDLNAPVEKNDVVIEQEEKTPMAELKPSMINETPVLDRDSAQSDVFRMRSSALKELTSLLDKPQAPNFANPQIKSWYTSIFREIVACLNVEKTSDLNALMNFILKLMKENDRVYGVRRVFGPLQTMTISDKDLRFYEEIFNVLIMIDSGAKITKPVLDEKFNGLLNADKSERFAKWVIAKQG